MEVQHLELSPAERDFYDTLWRKAKTERRPKRLLLSSYHLCASERWRGTFNECAVGEQWICRVFISRRCRADLLRWIRWFHATEV